MKSNDNNISIKYKDIIKVRPINIFTLNELGIDKGKFTDKIKGYYSHYEYDEYLYRQNLIKKVIEYGGGDLRDDLKIIEDFYLTGKGDFIDKLKQFQDITYNIKRYRKRMISNLLVNKNGEINREIGKSFGQEKAGVVDGVFDFRFYPRYFREAPDGILDEDTFKIVKHFTDLIFKENMCIDVIRVVIHYTIIEIDYCDLNSNSPEGIHQDGMDYIISALVIERNNIKGGVSRIYYPDYNSKILDVELQEGMGIFQPDMNTNLWHEVNDIYIDNEKHPGFRSTIGFDFEMVK